MNTTEQNDMQMSMMLTAIGQAMAYSDIKNAKELQSLAMDWVKNPNTRQSIYKSFSICAGWVGTSSFAGVEAPLITEADARLISAAPDLLFALTQLTKYVPTPADWAFARAALAKATGAQS